MLDIDNVPQKCQPDTKPKYPNNPEQTRWLAQTKNGNGAAFGHIVEKYQRPVYNLCYHMLSDPRDAEDAAQEVFLRAYARLESYDDTAKFSTWLFSIASHYCIDKLRKRRFKLISWDDLGGWYPFPDQNTPQPEKRLIEAESAREVRTCLKMLPSDDRLAVILRYWYTMSYQEIAQTLGTTVSAIKSKLYRARKKMAAAKAASRHQSSSNTLSQVVLIYGNHSG